MQIVLVAGEGFMVSDFVVFTAFANVLQFYSRSACSQKATLTVQAYGTHFWTLMVYSNISNSFINITKSFRNITKSISNILNSFTNIPNSFRNILKSIRNITKSDHFQIFLNHK